MRSPSVHGQNARTGTDWMPRTGYFERLVASPTEARFAVALISSDLLEARTGEPGRTDLDIDGDPSLQGLAALGGTLRLWRAAEWRGGGLITGLQAVVFGRFLLSDSKNTLVGSDWMVALPFEARKGRASGRFRLLHWSAHLGDELIAETGVEREDFTFEALDLMTAYDLGALRLYGGGTWVMRSQLEDASGVAPGFSDDGGVEVGVDGRWDPRGPGGIGLRGGLDLRWNDRVDWRRQLAGTVAVEARRENRGVSVGLVFFDGPSPMGQFYLNEESFWGLEIRVDF